MSLQTKTLAALKSLSRYATQHRVEGSTQKRRQLARGIRSLERLEKRELLAGVVMDAFTANGATQLTLSYQVTAPTSTLKVGFYRSADVVFGGDTLLRTITLNTAADLSVGAHSKTLTIGTGTGQVPLPGAGAGEVASDYYLLAVANPSSPDSDGVAVFSGVYHPAGGGVYIHGRNLVDNVTIDSSYQVTLNGLMKQYTAADVTSFRVRTHDGNDSIDGTTAAKTIWASGGAGDDAMIGGSAVDTLLGDVGLDTLTGGGGNDSLNGGQDGDRYIVSGTTAGTDAVRDSGTLGVDRLIAGSVNTKILLGTTYSKLLTGLEEISANGFAGVSLAGTAGIDSLSFAGIVISGVSAIDALAGADTVVGSDGADSILGGLGNDSLDGGGGVDTANFAGAYASYGITVVGNALQVVDGAPTVLGDDGTDTLLNFEYLKFSDALISVVSIFNTSPVAVADTATIGEDAGTVLIPVLDNDTDADATDTKRVVSVSSPGVRGIVQVASNGVIFYPNRGYEFLKAGESVVETFFYTMADAAGAQSTTSVVVTVTGANDAPVAVGDVATVSEDAGATSLTVLSNDTDVDLGDTKSIVSFNGDGYPGGWELVCIYGVCAPLAYPGLPAILGTLSIAQDGQSLIYSPGNAFQYLKAGQTSTERFSYTIADAAGALSSNWVTLTISGANDAPVARPDSLLVAKNSAPVSVNVLVNDTDADTGDTKTVLALNTSGLLGSATIAADGKSVIYAVGSAFESLAPDQTASEAFTYTISDAAGAQSTSTVTIRVSGANTVPVAVADFGAATENGAPVSIDVLANDTDADLGDTKTVVAVSAVGLLGLVSIAPGGTGVVYTIGNAFQSLAAGATATEVFSYTMRDSGGAQSTAQVTVTVTGANDSPVAVANTATTSEDGAPITIDVLANDSDVDQGDTKQIVSVLTTNLQGSVTVAPDGKSVSYSVGGAFQSLRAGASATEVFSYTMRDGSGASSTANVTVTITGVNDSPIAVENAFTVTEDATTTTLAVLANDTDPDVGDTKRVVSVNTAGMLGTATVAANGTGVLYSAGNAFQHLIAGQTATETFTYTMADAVGVQSTAVVTLTVTGVTDGPKAIHDTVTADEDGGQIVINVLANDTNDLSPGDTLTISSIDGAGRYASMTLILIYGVGVGQYNPGFQRMLGQASIAPDGRSILYTPMQSLNAGEVGADKFLYTITGTGGGSSTGIVTVNVTGANDAPIAGNDSVTIAADAAPTTINVLANDIDADNRIDPPPPVADELGPWDVTPADTPDISTVVAVNASGLQGSVAISPNGKSVVYTVGGDLLSLRFGATATETFTYTMQDSVGAQSTATVTINITGNNHAPIAVDDTAEAVENGAPVSISVLANDTDLDISAGDSPTLVSLNIASLQGSVAIVGSNIVYTVGNAFQSLRAGVTATEVFSYTMKDSGGLQSTARVTVTINGANDAPIAVANTLSISEDASPTLLSVLANDTDSDTGDTKVVVLVNTVGVQGSVAITAGGSDVIYTVAPAFQNLNTGQTATESFTYTMVDSFGAQSTATVTITIIGANEPVVYVSPPPPPVGAIVGTTADDILVTAAAADIIYGMAGDDDISSGAGADTIFGGEGRDTIDGGDGNDIINGGGDRDDLTGGTGADVFKYYLASESTVAATDRIRDFNAGEGDKIDLSLIDASTSVGGNNSFVVVGSYTGVAGQLLIVNMGAGLFQIRGDVNGDGITDLQIEVKSRVTLVATDIIL